MGKSELGKRGEEIAAVYLKKRGYRVLARNWSVRGRDGKMLGELDIVARRGVDIVFVEVKAGSLRDEEWRPEIHASSKKLFRLKRAAQIWLAQNRLLDAPWQIDVVAVDFSYDPPRLRHIPQVTN